MNQTEHLVHSRNLPADQPGELLTFPRETAAWQWMSFFVRWLLPRASWESAPENEELLLVLLGGDARRIGRGPHLIGQRKNVFDGFP
jgi:5-deoxy-D-glucuronate isomerase